MKTTLAELLHHPLVWRGDQLASSSEAVSSGFAALDQELPGGGWPKGALIELLRDGEGIGELRLLLPALKSVVKGGEWILLVAPPHVPYAPAFAAGGIDPARVIVVAAAEEKHRWWAAEQVLRASAAGALLFWPQLVSDERLRRLQLAAQEGATPGFVFTSTERATQPSPAPLRIRLSVAERCLRIDVFKRRGGMMARPLLLDVAVASRENGRVASTARPTTTKLDRTLAQRPPSFHRRYPIGASTRIWNRALARADEVRRIPVPDPRGVA
jgi:cell division inhibitor SulA